METSTIEVGSWAIDAEGRTVQVTEIHPVYKYERGDKTEEVEGYVAKLKGFGDGSMLVGDWLNPDTLNLRGDWTGARNLEELRVIDDPAAVEEARQRSLDVEEREIKKFIASLEARLKRINREREA